MVQILNSIQKRVADEAFLVEAFNDEYNSNAIITHFRVGILCLTIIRPPLALKGEKFWNGF